MWVMGVEVPDLADLLQLSSPATYGDDAGDVLGHATNHSDGQHRRGGALHLSSVLPALSSAIGVPVETAVHRDPRKLQRALGLPDASSAIVVLIDGLGYWNILMRLGHAPYLRSLFNEPVNQRPIATCTPSTTVAAMATFGTGTCPGLTGMTGYTQRNPETGKLSQLIQFRDAPEPLDLQRQPTVFEKLSAHHVRVTSCGLPKFADSPLTQAALRGADYVAGDSARARVLHACEAAKTPGLTYLYIRDADKVGHGYGWDSQRWTGTFENIDAQLRLLHDHAPAGTLITIVADHGMITALAEERIDIATDSRLTQGVAMVGGEPREVMLYAQDGENPEDIAERWREVLQGRAVVRTRSQALADHMFGPVDPRVHAVLGDVIVSAADRVTIVDSRNQTDKATRLPSVHGSLSSVELDIPCLIDVV